MKSNISDRTSDYYLASIVGAKHVDSVIKTEFAQWLSSIPIDKKIFAVEGKGDRNAYYHWIKNVSPELSYEFFQCGNKNLVLQLFDTLERDRTGAGDSTYFFVDRDFDDLQGRAPSPRIFMTCKYSIENYLVTHQVLNDVLVLDFHCNGAPGVRSSVVDLFTRVYDQHLAVTRDLNFRAFVVKALDFERADSYPERINKISLVELDSVQPLQEDPASEIVWERPLDEIEERNLREKFDELSPRDRYRGKFALAFFIRWLELLREARQSPDCKLFAPLGVPENRVLGNFSFETLVSKASPPIGLREFLAAM